MFPTKPRAYNTLYHDEKERREGEGRKKTDEKTHRKVRRERRIEGGWERERERETRSRRRNLNDEKEKNRGSLVVEEKEKRDRTKEETSRIKRERERERLAGSESRFPRLRSIPPPSLPSLSSPPPCVLLILSVFTMSRFSFLSLQPVSLTLRLAIGS